MAEREEYLTIDELADRVGVPIRTVRFYIAEGLLPGPGTRGKSAAYGEEHLLRLRLIRRLVEQRVPLATIRSMLAELSVQEVRTLLDEEESRAAELRLAAETQSPRDYLAALLDEVRRARERKPAHSPASVYSTRRPPSTPGSSVAAPTSTPAEVWHRWVIAPGVELHVRGDARERQRGLIARMLALRAEATSTQEAQAGDKPGSA